jgi:hypothetical protein
LATDNVAVEAIDLIKPIKLLVETKEVEARTSNILIWQARAVAEVLATKISFPRDLATLIEAVVAIDFVRLISLATDNVAAAATDLTAPMTLLRVTAVVDKADKILLICLVKEVEDKLATNFVTEIRLKTFATAVEATVSA